MDLRQFEHLNVNNTKHTVPFRVRTNIITIKTIFIRWH